MTSQFDKHDETQRLADLIELAATWCESTARAEKFEPVAALWRKRAEMLRTGYQPMLVRARASAPSSIAPKGWRLVPEQWTTEMAHAGYEVHKNDKIACYECGQIYTAMLAAAPQYGPGPGVDVSVKDLTELQGALRDGLERRGEAALSATRRSEIPVELFSGVDVYASLTDHELTNMTPQHVSTVLDAVVRLIRKNRSDDGAEKA